MSDYHRVSLDVPPTRESTDSVIGDSSSRLLHDHDEKGIARSQKSLSNRRRYSKHLGFFSYVLNVVLLGGIIFAFLRPLPDPSLTATSPAHKAIEYKPVVFGEGIFEQQSKYQGWPTDEKDQLWYDLWEYGTVLALDENEAKQLMNKTERVPWGPHKGKHMAGVTVFHQLHCVDELRKSLYPQRYNNSVWNLDGTFNNMTFIHHDHCIELLRQAIMCHGDTSIFVYRWNPYRGHTRVHFDNWHSCRNYDAIKQWAIERDVGMYRARDRLVIEGDNLPVDHDRPEDDVQVKEQELGVAKKIVFDNS